MQRLSDASELIRERRVSPVELVTDCLERIERLQPKLNAFITVAAESALREANEAEADVKEGRWKGGLHGIPVAIKDFYDTAGLATTAAFERFKNRMPNKDAAAVGKLRRAGAIVLGKTNMHTLGMGTTGLESCFGPVKNPWNADYIPGGSSSGSAAAVASGLCCATLDTDAIGSCRLPAACCGVVGFKGSYGLIDMRGILDGEQPPDDTIRWLSHAGLMTRSVLDTAIVLDALASRRDARPATWVAALAEQRPLRIAIANNYKTDQEVSEVFDQAVRTIRTLGHVVAYAPAPLTDMRKGIANIEHDRQTIGRLVFKDIDVLILPTTTSATLTVKDALKSPLALSPALTMFANYYGLPAISVPCGVDRRVLPVGMQIVAKPGDDALVLQVGSQFERAAEFEQRHRIE